MDRRKFLSLSIVTIVAISMPVNLEASVSAYDITFAKFYPKAFWKKNYFNWIILVFSIVSAGLISFFTAGAGAPEAAAGVSTVASWVGGGGAGSYMAGLSTIGSAVGGNAMIGAAILNGISLGTIGLSASKVTLTLASKIALAVDATMSGFALIKNLQSKRSVYVFDIKIPKGIGSKEVEELVDEIYDLYDEKQSALEKKKYEKANSLEEKLRNYYILGEKMLKKELKKEEPNIYDLVVLGIVVYKLGNINLYYEALYNIEFLYGKKLENRSFLDYLWGIYYLSTPNKEKKAFKYFQNSYYEENYVIEPVLIIIDILGQNYNKNKILITSWVKNAAENYDSDKYDGKGLLNLYYKAATIAFLNSDWKQAIKYYENAYDELGIIGKLIWTTKPIKKQLKLYIAICYKHLGDDKKALEYLNDALDFCENNKEKEEIKKVYNEI